jgi:TP901 family phage tail tape measure protein
MGVAARTAGERLRDSQGRFIAHESSVRKLVAAYDKLNFAMGGLLGAFAGFAIVRQAISVISEFGETMATVGGVLGLLTNQTAETQAQFEALNAQARQLGATTRFSAKQAAEGQLALARSGFTVEEVQLATADALNLAAAASLELGRAAEITAITIRQFGLSALDATRVTDVLVTTSNRSATTVEQLAQGLKFAGTIASGFGKSLEETAAALGVLSNAGLQATQAGTSLRGVFAALSSPSAQAAETIANLARASGQSVSDFDILTNSIQEVFEAFKRAGAGPREFLTIFGRLQAPGALALTNAAEDIGKIEEANKAVETSAKALADIINDTLKGDILALKAAFDELFLSANDGVGPALRSIIQTATEVIRILAGMEEGAQKYSTAAKIIVVVMKSVIAAFGIFIGLKIVGALFAIGKAITTVTISLKALRVALLSTGVGALAVGLGIATVAALEFFGTVEDGSKKLQETREKEIEQARKAHNEASALQQQLARQQQLANQKRIDDEAKKIEAENKLRDARKRAADQAAKAERTARANAAKSIANIERELDRRKFLAQFEEGEARKREAEVAKLIDLEKRRIGLKPGDVVPDEVRGELQDFADSYRTALDEITAAESRTALAAGAIRNFENLEKAVAAAERELDKFNRSASGQIRLATFEEFRDEFAEVVRNAGIAADELIADGLSVEEAWEAASAGVTDFKNNVAELARLRVLQNLIPDVNAAKDAFLALAGSQNFSVEGLAALEDAGATAIAAYEEAIASGAANSAELEQAIADIRDEVKRFGANTDFARALEPVESIAQSATVAFVDLFRSIVTGSESATDAIIKFGEALVNAAVQEFVIKGLQAAIGGAFDSLTAPAPGTGVSSLPSPAAPATGSGIGALPDVTSSGVGFRSGSIATGAPAVSTRTFGDRGSVAAGGTTVIQNIQTANADSFTRSQRQIASRAAEGTQVSRRRTQRPAA